ncbi:ribosome maturation factor RimP [Abyssisolibacter fermentans]|uniref:ribosome maturation factor RimP n=1 Tax=Abyssisolibacter fermentans TaxID=1766203 RepID=UPI00082A3ABB|nr:ribosome maturation factor RimP [Abyssisolibacter fermentans]
MNKKSIIELVKKIVKDILLNTEFYLVDVEFAKEGIHTYLRVFADKPGGISLDDCQYISQKLSAILDEKDPIEENYFLEVSSPGIDRPFKTDEDFERNLNEYVEISLYKAIDGSKKFMGKLLDYNDTVVTIQEDDSEPLVIQRDQISKINLAILI